MDLGAAAGAHRIRILAGRRGRRRKSCRVNGNRNGVIYDLRESPQADDVRASAVLEQQHYLPERMLPPRLVWISWCGMDHPLVHLDTFL